MEVIAISPRGYCHGVVNALKVAKEAAIKHSNEQVYILGIIIHNKFVKKALDRLNIISVYDKNKSRFELLDEIDSGVVIFSAHGVGDDVIAKAQAKNLTYYDATCKDVKKTQKIVSEYLSLGYDVLYIGKKNHPESEAMLSIDHKKIKLISDLSDLDNLEIKDQTLLTNQTTMSVYDTKNLVNKILSINNNIIVENEICLATQMRQEALFDLKDFDLLYVVGDHLSNNTNNLAKIAKTSLSNVKLIESVMDIDDNDLINIKKVGVTSGASTPTALTNQVINYLKKYPNTSASDRVIDYNSLL